jgi:hypothetical protein
MPLLKGIELMFGPVFLQLLFMLTYRSAILRAGHGGVSRREGQSFAPAIVPIFLSSLFALAMWDYASVYGWRFAIGALWWGPIGALLAYFVGYWVMRRAFDRLDATQLK